MFFVTKPDTARLLKVFLRDISTTNLYRDYVSISKKLQGLPLWLFRIQKAVGNPPGGLRYSDCSFCLFHNSYLLKLLGDKGKERFEQSEESGKSVVGVVLRIHILVGKRNACIV